MLGQDCYALISLGLWIRAIRSLKDTSQKEWILNSYNTLYGLLERNNLVVSLAYLKSTEHNSLVTDIKKIANNTTPIGKEICLKIITEMSNLEQIVFAESSTKNIYILPERRFNSDYLMNKPSKLLKDGTFDKLSPIARSDIDSACKCLLFGQATASAFHILRATEDVLKSYYFHHCKQNRLKKPMWADMLKQLRTKKSKKPPSVLLDSLDLIRNSYRNPTQHPEAVYDIDNAQNLFGVCFDVIEQMGNELVIH